MPAMDLGSDNVEPEEEVFLIIVASFCALGQYSILCQSGYPSSTASTCSGSPSQPSWIGVSPLRTAGQYIS